MKSKIKKLGKAVFHAIGHCALSMTSSKNEERDDKAIQDELDRHKVLPDTGGVIRNQNDLDTSLKDNEYQSALSSSGKLSDS